MLGLSLSDRTYIHMPSLLSALLCLPAFFICSCVCGMCGLSLKHGNAFTACSPTPRFPRSPVPGPCSAVLLARRLLLLPLGRSITLQVGNKVVKTNGLRDKMRLLKLHVCKLTCCVTVCVCAVCGCADVPVC